MCGIAGEVVSLNGNYKIEAESLKNAGRYLQFRGPDFQDLCCITNNGVQVGFYHARLSIIDLSNAASQPMQSPSGRTLIVFNGEIYNYKELRGRLIALGYQFRTGSDTEVIIVAYETWGLETTLALLDGMFAFAIFDKRENVCFLARDRFGKKPIYYSIANGGLSFSSDIRSFRFLNSKGKQVNQYALGYYFAELSTPENESIWEGINKLPPGSYLTFHDDSKSKILKYWTPSYSLDCKLSRNEIVEKADYLIGQAVEKRLVADVPVAALLSGGIDSSLVVAKMAESSVTPVRTFSVGFLESDFNELPYAKQVAERFSTNHTEVLLEPTGIDGVDKIIDEFGEPFADSSMLPSYLISKVVSKEVKVVLGGDGGDELFAGYYSYQFAYGYDKFKGYSWLLPAIRGLNAIWPSVRGMQMQKALNQRYKKPDTLLDRNLGFDEDGLKMLFDRTEFYESLRKEHERVWAENRYSQYDLSNVLKASLKTRLLNDYLVKVDRASMFASLEMRSPFLDKDLFQFASTLLPSQLYTPYGPKSVLKALTEKYFPKSFVHREKQGFSIPLAAWLRKDFKREMGEIILNDNPLVNLNRTYIERIWKEHQAGGIDHAHRLWAVYVFNTWAESNK